MIKLFASDLDGTLFNALHEADSRVRAGVSAALDAGRHVALATGRWSASPAELGFPDMPMELVCGNGAFVYGADGELLRRVPIDPATIEELLASFPTICVTCVTVGGTLVRGTREQQLASYRPSRGLLGRIASWRFKQGRGGAGGMRMRYDQTNAEVLRHEVCKLNSRTNDEGLRRELDAFVAEHADTLVNASFDGELFELTAAGVDKGEAVAWLAGHLGMGEDEVAVYGDGGNDIAMLERFEHAYATSGASASAKAAAGNVIGSCALYAVPRHIARTVRREGPIA